jgi:hypothetical protein
MLKKNKNLLNLQLRNRIIYTNNALMRNRFVINNRLHALNPTLRNAIINRQQIMMNRHASMMNHQSLLNRQLRKNMFNPAIQRIRPQAIPIRNQSAVMNRIRMPIPSTINNRNKPMPAARVNRRVAKAAVKDNYDFATSKYVYKNIGLRNKKYTTSIMIYVKNNVDLLQEWIEYHKKIGINHIYLIDGTNPSIVTQLDKEIKDGYVTYIYDSKNITTDYASNLILNKYRNETVWLINLQLNEFIVLKNGQNINSLLSGYNNHGGLNIVEYTFGSNEHVTHQNNTFEAYTKRVGGKNVKLEYKPFLITDRTIRINSNSIMNIRGYSMVDERNNIVAGNDVKVESNGIIQINRYNRSLEDYEKTGEDINKFREVDANATIIDRTILNN